MKKISVVIITYNEEKNIGEALESVKWADEVVIVDSYSQDKTVEVCRRYTDKVFQRAWTGYVDQKNFGLAQAACDWVLSLDADERVSAELENEIAAWKNKDESAAVGYLIPRKTFFLGKWIRHTDWYPDYQLRLFRKTAGRWEGGRVHESVKASGPIGKFSGELLHFSYRSISEYLARLNRYSGLAAQDRHDQGKRASLLNTLFGPCFAFIRSYFLKQGFKDGYQGLIISVLSAVSVFFKLVKQWELEHVDASDSEDGNKKEHSVLFIDTERVWRGGQSQLFFLMKELKRRAYRVALVAPPGSPLGCKAKSEGIPTYGLELKNELDVSKFHKFYSLFKSEGFDIIHFNTPRAILIGTLASKLAKVPVRVVSRSVNFPLRLGPLSRFKYSWGIDKIIAVSHSVKSTLVNGGIRPDLVEVIHEGIDVEEFDKAPKAKAEFYDPSFTYVGTIGQLTEEKGHDVLIEAAAKVCRARAALRFVIVGDGELRSALKQRVKGLGLSEKIIFTGFREDILSLICSFDIFVLPSRSEGFSVVTLYAMAAARPVVASQVGGVVEVVEDKVTGLLVPAGDPVRLAEAIRYLHDDPARAKAMGGAGRKRLESHFALKTKVSRTVDLYERLVKGKRGEG